MENFTVSSEIKYAGFWLRFVAALLDGLIIGFVQFVFIGPILGLLGFSASLVQLSGLNDLDLSEEEKIAMLVSIMGVIFMLSIIGVVINWLYYALMESSKRQATLGKMALGLKVTDLNGERVTFLRATGRYFGKIISGMIFAIGYIMAGFTARKQALHDIMANCLVIRSENS